MAQNITLQGASYSDVPSVVLPKTGGGTASFTDVTGTTAAAADVASGKYFFTAEGVLTLGTSSGGGGSVTQDANGFIVLPETGGGGGGGATNCVCGTFTTSSTTGAASTFTIPYTGSGYPIFLSVYIDGGVRNRTSGGNSDWIELVQRYVYGAFTISKQETNTEPSYAASSSLTNNLGYVTYLYKNSTTDPTSMATSGSNGDVVSYNSGDATTTATDVMRFKGNGTTVSYFVASTGRGLLADTDYAYIAVYSS